MVQYKQESPFGDKQYYDSPAELDKIRRRAEIRARLKTEWTRMRFNPYTMINCIHPEDPSVSRFMAARVTLEYAKPNWRQFRGFFMINFAPLIIGYLILSQDLDQKRGAISKGYVPYADRMYKSF